MNKRFSFRELLEVRRTYLLIVWKKLRKFINIFKSAIVYLIYLLVVKLPVLALPEIKKIPWSIKFRLLLILFHIVIYWTTLKEFGMFMLMKLSILWLLGHLWSLISTRMLIYSSFRPWLLDFHTVLDRVVMMCLLENWALSNVFTFFM